MGPPAAAAVFLRSLSLSYLKKYEKGNNYVISSLFPSFSPDFSPEKKRIHFYFFLLRFMVFLLLLPPKIGTNFFFFFRKLQPLLQRRIAFEHGKQRSVCQFYNALSPLLLACIIIFAPSAPLGKSGAAKLASLFPLYARGRALVALEWYVFLLLLFARG